MPGFLGSLLTTATQSVGDYEGAQRKAAEEGIAGALQRAQLVRQAQQQAIQEQVAARQGRSADISDRLNTYKLEHPTIDPLSEQGIAAKTQLEHDKTDYDRTHGYHAPVLGSYEKVDTADPKTGKPMVGVLDKHTGKINQTGVPGKAPGAGGMGGAQGIINNVRVKSAGSQIANADDDMTAFEDDVMHNRARIDALGLELAQKAMKSDMGSQVAYQALVRHNPSLAKYVRSAKEAATAERKIEPRGGSNALMQAEQILMQGGAGGDPNLIKQARAYRKTLRDALNPSDETAPGTGAASADEVEAMLREFEQQ